MMGPYMSPIPSNASAAMIFSFFVAVMVTPWLMMKIRQVPIGHGGGSDGHGDQKAVASRRPLCWPDGTPNPCDQSQGVGLPARWSGVATLGSLGTILHPACHREAAALRQQVRSSWCNSICRRGASVEDTDRVLMRIADALRPVAEIESLQTHAGTAAPFNFNGLVRHSYLRAPSRRLGDRSGEFEAEDLPATARATP